MKSIQEIFENSRGLSEEEQNKLVAEYMEQFDEDTILEDIEKFSADTLQRMKDLENKVVALRTKWLNESWVNKSDICNRLYGKADKSTVGYFTQQRQGKKPWKPEQLKRLDEIRKELMESLKV